LDPADRWLKVKEDGMPKNDVNQLWKDAKDSKPGGANAAGLLEVIDRELKTNAKAYSADEIMKLREAKAFCERTASDAYGRSAAFEGKLGSSD
jgi:hypothetical protein